MSPCRDASSLYNFDVQLIVGYVRAALEASSSTPYLTGTCTAQSCHLCTDRTSVSTVVAVARTRKRFGVIPSPKKRAASRTPLLTPLFPVKTVHEQDDAMLKSCLVAVGITAGAWAVLLWSRKHSSRLRLLRYVLFYHVPPLLSFAENLSPAGVAQRSVPSFAIMYTRCLAAQQVCFASHTYINGEKKK